MAATVRSMLSSTIATLKAAGAHYESVKEDKSLREAFHGAGRGLPLVHQALEAAAARSKSVEVLQCTMGTLKSCKTKGETSQELFNAVAKAPETSRFEEYKAVVRHRGKGQTVEVLVVGMMKEVCAVAEDLAIQDQAKGLRDAMEKLSKMESSIPNEGSGDTFTHYGSGDMLNAPGGTVNKSAGDGNHFPGATFSGSVSFGKAP